MSFATAGSTGAFSVSPFLMAMGRTSGGRSCGGREVQVAPGEDIQPRYQRDVGRAVELALTGVMDGRIVNIVDDAPTTCYEIASLVGFPIEPSAEPLTNPWMGRMDGSRSRALGFHPTVPTGPQAE